MTYDKSVSIPLIDNISNLLDGIVVKVNNSISFKINQNNNQILTNRIYNVSKNKNIDNPNN